jgi:hypothetical protein
VAVARELSKEVKKREVFSYEDLYKDELMEFGTRSYSVQRSPRQSIARYSSLTSEPLLLS